MEMTKTNRGFELGKFVDRRGSNCSIQKSSVATENCIWLGVDDANPQIMAFDAIRLGIPANQNSGWIKYEIPKEVLLSTRMHLSQEQVRDLIPILQRFVDTGDI